MKKDRIIIESMGIFRLVQPFFLVPVQGADSSFSFVHLGLGTVVVKGFVQAESKFVVLDELCSATWRNIGGYVSAKQLLEFFCIDLIHLTPPTEAWVA